MFRQYATCIKYVRMFIQSEISFLGLYLDEITVECVKVVSAKWFALF